MFFSYSVYILTLWQFLQSSDRAQRVEFGRLKVACVPAECRGLHTEPRGQWCVPMQDYHETAKVRR